MFLLEAKQKKVAKTKRALRLYLNYTLDYIQVK